VIYAPNNEPVRIVSTPYMDLLDPTTADFPLVKVQFVNMPGDKTYPARICRLHADGGQQEIDEAIAVLTEKGA